jgi:hypothetical protein
MRTATYSRFLDRICGVLGIPRSNLQTDEAELLNSHFNRAVKQIWEAAPWPGICVTEARTPDANFLIDYEQTDETEIGTVFAVYDKDPYGTEAFEALPFALTADGIQLVNCDSDDDVYVYYRQRCPDYDGDDYSASTTYAVDDQVYYASTGDYYKCILASLANAPTSTTYWERLTIPYDFMDFIVQAVYAEWLKSEGQQEKSTLQARYAEGALIEEVDRLERQQGTMLPLNIRTHLSTYSR